MDDDEASSDAGDRAGASSLRCHRVRQKPRGESPWFIDHDVMHRSEHVEDRRWTVFLGPSLARERADQILAADYRPPIARGDLDSLVRQGRRLFAIIDGVFDQNRSVSITEIRDALEAGSTVIGASSMGALRAAETAAIGMQGIGWIFEAYQGGRIQSDAEVCLTFRADTWQPLTIPLVNVRWAAEQLASSGIVTELEALGIVEIAARVDFRERDGRRIIAAAERSPGKLAQAARLLVDWLQSDAEHHDRKALDAVEALRRLRDDRIRRRPVVVRRDDSRHWSDSAPARESFFRARGGVSTADELLELAWADARVAGVTRLADLTELDACGVHVWSTARPLAEEGDLTVNGGKGVSRVDAQIGALMESVERWCATTRGRDIRRASSAELHDALDPRRLILPAGRPWDASRPLGWMMARNLVDGSAILVPAVAACLTCPEDRWVFPGGSTGLAAEVDLSRAALAGLLEVIERDALAFHEWRRTGRPIDLDSVEDPDSRRLVSESIERGLDVRAFALPGPIAITTIQVVLDDAARDSALYINAGTATHLSAEIAFKKALLEAQFSRVTIIAGARENIDRLEAESEAQGATRIRAALRALGGSPLALAQCPVWTCSDPADALAQTIEALAAAGFRRVLACRLTSLRMVNEAVRVIVPGMEPGGPAGRIGPRLFRSLKSSVGDCRAPRPPIAVRHHPSGSPNE